jgi:multicomponent Na+:H+ antiporter subunit E
MYIHALDARTAAEVEAGVRAIERRLLRWLDAGAPDVAADGTGRNTT